MARAADANPLEVRGVVFRLPASGQAAEGRVAARPNRPGAAPLRFDRVRRRREGGSSLVEVLIAAAVLVVAALGYAASVSAGHALTVSVDERGQAVETLQRLVERLRADPDWAGLYARLKPRSGESVGDVTLARVGVDTALPTYSLGTYYADLVPPASLGTVTALVQVSSTVVDDIPALRENASAPRYGLPRDLNGDGVVDAVSRATDYRSLPIVVRLRWQRPGRAADEIVLATWLRGDR